MCGIAGLLAPRGQRPDAATLQRMLDVIIHRGPDDQGTYGSGTLAFGMRRLSIIDLTTGKQPIHNEDRTIWVILNGEIYNYRALRSELQAAGHRFYTDSDTEVLVHLYEEHGEDFVTRLNGMYSIALYDERLETLLLYRDRIGEKQLYYTYRNGALAFGSEIKCVLESRLPSRALNLRSADSYFTFMYTCAPETIYADVQELPPAHLCRVDANGLTLRRYWSLDVPVDTARDPAEWPEAFLGQLRQSVRSRLVSDVPLGALLSGGIDSSAVVAMMAEAASGPVRTFCIGYGQEGAYYDERPYARQVAKIFGTQHAEFVITPDILKVIPDLVGAFDQPFADSSSIANYYVFRETAQHVKVVLSGLGGDEIGAGYERYGALRLHALYSRLPAALRSWLIRPLITRLPEPRSGGRAIDRLKRFVREGDKQPLEAYLGYVSALDAARRAELWTPSARAELGAFDSGANLATLFAQDETRDVLNRALFTDIATYLPGDLLTLTDRMSMLSSIEARAPFVDHEFVEFMARVPPSVKSRGTDKKTLFKRALAGLLPHDLMHRRKQGFTVPLTVWLRNELKPLVHSVLSRERIEHVGLFNWPYVDRLIGEHMSLKENHHNRLWGLLMFMCWHERYIGH